MTGDFKDDVAQRELQLLDDIQSKLTQLQKLQKEKDCLLNNKIHPDLINENCFPEMADIIRQNLVTKQMDIVTLSDSSSDSYRSWSDTWSTE